MNYLKWALKLKVVTGDRGIVDAVLLALGLQTTQSGELLLAHGPSLDQMQNVGEVHAHGSRIVGRLNDLRQHDLTLAFDVRLDSLLEYGANGVQVSNTVFIIGNAAVVSAGALAVSAVLHETPEAKAEREAQAERLEYERRERLAIAHVVPAVQSEGAATIERLLQMEQSPTTLYNILETIEKDGTIPIKDLASKTKWALCKQSMCHPAAVGDSARHVASPDLPPPKPMRLREAREFVASLTMTWLEKKAGLMP